jgi:hypothetical protein
MLNLAFEPSWVQMGHVPSAYYFYTTSVPFRPTMVQMPNFALIEKKGITVTLYCIVLVLIPQTIMLKYTIIC